MGAGSEQARKADYYFMEALRREAAGEPDAAFLMLRRAYMLDSVSGTDVGGLLGARLVALSRGDSVMMSAGVRLLEKHFAANPSDLYAGLNLSHYYERMSLPGKSLAVWATLDSAHSDNPAVVWNRAGREIQFGNRDLALGLLDRLEKMDGMNEGITAQKAQIMVESGDTAAAVAEVRRLLAAKPHDANARVLAASVFGHIGLPDSASAYLDLALELDPTNGAAYFQRALSYKESGRLDEYNAEIADAVRLDDLDLESKLGLLTDYLRQYADSTGRKGEIEDLFSSLVEQYPHEASVHRMFCSYYLVLKDFGHAAEQLGYVADMNPDDGEVWENVIRLYATADSLGASIAAGRQALRYHPDNVGVRRLLSMVYMQDNRLDSAMVELRRLTALTSDDPLELSQTYSTMGDLYQKLECGDSAVVCYEKAIDLDPDNDLALNNYAFYISDLSNAGESKLRNAEEMISRALKLNPGQPTYLDTYAWILFRQAEYKRAKEYIDATMAAIGDDPPAEVLEHAGDIVFMLGQHEQALEYWREALAKEPDNDLLRRKVKHKTYFYALVSTKKS